MSSLILVCAATSVEAKACRQGIKKSGQSDRYEILQVGMGMAHAKRTLEKRLMGSQLPRPTLVVSTGFAGSLSLSLPVGTWIYGKSIETENAVFKFELETLNRKLSLPIHASRVISLLKASSQDKVVFKPDSDL